MGEARNQTKINGKSGFNQTAAANFIAVLQELFDLLEDYGPTWYTQEAHDRAFQVLMQRSH